jgi:hypothetical protein
MTFLPLTSVMAQCELTCALGASAQSVSHAEHAASVRHMHHAHHAHYAQHEPDKALDHASMQHAGACHLAAIPVLATDEPGKTPTAVTPDWAPDSRSTPLSLVWPPPEHPPRS